MPLKFLDMMNLMERFHKEEECRKVLEELRWPNGVACPRCGSLEHAHDTVRGVYDCVSCGYQFSVLAGTIFHDTKLPLRKWFMAILLMVEAKKGISANQMKRTLGVSYKTAWYLCHRIRAAMAEVNPELLGGTVEVDETYVGGKVRGKGHGYRGNKATVVGVVQRKGEIRLQVASGADRATLHRIIHQHVRPDAPNIYTDEWAGYRGVGDADTVHETVNHNVEEWVRGDVHTQTVEGVWSLLKRSIVGSYHKVSVKHLDAYLDELEWRFNNRKNPYLFRDTLVKLLTAESLPYQKLTG
jgi:transposase-like protein